MKFVSCPEKQEFKNNFLEHASNDPINLALVLSFEKKMDNYGAISFPIIVFYNEAGKRVHSWNFEYDTKLRDEVYDRLCKDVISPRDL